MIRILNHQLNSLEWIFLSKMRGFNSSQLGTITLLDHINNPLRLLIDVSLVNSIFRNFIFCSILAEILMNCLSFALLCLANALFSLHNFIEPTLWWTFSIKYFPSFACFFHSSTLDHLRIRIENGFSWKISYKILRNWWIFSCFKF